MASRRRPVDWKGPRFSGAFFFAVPLGVWALGFPYPLEKIKMVRGDIVIAPTPSVKVMSAFG